jgi:hypothetical protein
MPKSIEQKVFPDLAMRTIEKSESAAPSAQTPQSTQRDEYHRRKVIVKIFIAL